MMGIMALVNNEPNGEPVTGKRDQSSSNINENGAIPIHPNKRNRSLWSQVLASLYDTYGSDAIAMMPKREIGGSLERPL